MQRFLARHAFPILAFIALGFVWHAIFHRVTARAVEVLSSSPLTK